MRFIKNLLFGISHFLKGYLQSIIYYKTFRLYFCNQLTIGIKYLDTQKVNFPHPVGIVIGEKVKIGKNCTIFQNVTIGAKDTVGYKSAKYPILEDNVTVFANSIIFGDVTIGENSIIGCGSVVFKSIPPNSVVAGNPAVIKKYSK